MSEEKTTKKRKISKKARIKWLKYAISTKRGCAIRALLYIYENQTEDEKNTRTTKEHNCMGFNSFDADMLTGYVRYYQTYNSLTENQVKTLMQCMQKYAEQLLNTNKLDLERVDAYIERRMAEEEAKAKLAAEGQDHVQEEQVQ